MPLVVSHHHQPMVLRRARRPASSSRAGALLPMSPKGKEVLAVAGTEQGIWVDVAVSEVRPSDGGYPLAGRTSSS